MSNVSCTITDGIAHVRLDRPDKAQRAHPRPARRPGRDRVPAAPRQDAARGGRQRRG
ncbi:hypothetical protein [Nocardioides convexus]|uniref:hypothetical protein n=1 Tax=Nocardioides convexus TaxID=2712224 RepID=UPI0024184DE7|nr:hypothetical protein [Nocardioides convexus]